MKHSNHEAAPITTRGHQSPTTAAPTLHEAAATMWISEWIRTAGVMKIEGLKLSASARQKLCSDMMISMARTMDRKGYNSVSEYYGGNS